MSHAVQRPTEFHGPQALVAALAGLGFQESQIEVHAEAVPLYGYQGDVRPQRTHIVIRRQHIASGANDVGRERRPTARAAKHREGTLTPRRLTLELAL